MDIKLDYIIYKEIEEIGYLYLNAPHGNKMTIKFLDNIVEIFEDYIANSKISGLLITSNGKHFSSGADVEELVRNVLEKSIMDEEEVISFPDWFINNKNVFLAISDMKIPVVTVIKGFCIGSGLELALNGHIRICSDTSLVGFPESTFGLLPGATGTLRCTELIGIGNTMGIVLDGQFIDAKKATQMGLFNKCLPKDKVIEYGEFILKYIIKNVKEYNSKEIHKYIKNFEKEGIEL